MWVLPTCLFDWWKLQFFQSVLAIALIQVLSCNHFQGIQDTVALYLTQCRHAEEKHGTLARVNGERALRVELRGVWETRSVIRIDALTGWRSHEICTKRRAPRALVFLSSPMKSFISRLRLIGIRITYLS